MARDKVRTPTRRFPPPWSVEEEKGWFCVRDHNGQQLAYVYFDNPRAAAGPHLLSSPELSRQRVVWNPQCVERRLKSRQLGSEHPALP